MSERVEHRGTIERGEDVDPNGDEWWFGRCEGCPDQIPWEGGGYFVSRKRLIEDYQEHVYAAVGREAVELLGELRGDYARAHIDATCSTTTLGTRIYLFLAAVNAALEVEG